MADKDPTASHEPMGTGHQVTMQMPTLTSKPLKQQQALKDTTNQTDLPPPSGYYFNVAQKGKLILPTALWILLIVAGVSFLTLLASLNRTVDTLDTLIELEQEREARRERANHHLETGAAHHGHHSEHAHEHADDRRLPVVAGEDRPGRPWLQLVDKHQKQQQQPFPERIVIATMSGDDDDDNDDSDRDDNNNNDASNDKNEDDDNQRFIGGLMPIKASWFALPSWTSLEPVSHAQIMASGHRHRDRDGEQMAAASPEGQLGLVPPYIESIMNDMLRHRVGPMRPIDNEIAMVKKPESAGPVDGDSGFGDMFSFFFGSPPPVSMVADFSTTSPKVDTFGKGKPTTEGAEVSIEKLLHDKKDEPKVPMPIIVVDGGEASGGATKLSSVSDQLGDLLTSSLMPMITGFFSHTNRYNNRSSSSNNINSNSGDELNTTKGSSSEFANDSPFGDLFRSMFTMPQFGSDQPQRSTSDASPSGSSSSSSSVLIQSTTPISIMSRIATTKTTTETLGSSTPASDGEQVPEAANTGAKPNATSTTETILLGKSGGGGGDDDDDLPKLLRGFLGFGESEPFFSKEEVSPPVTLLSTTELKPLVVTAEATSRAPSANSASESAPVSSTGTPTILTISTNGGDSEREAAQTKPDATSAKPAPAAPFPEVVHNEESPSDIHVVALAPYANSLPPESEKAAGPQQRTSEAASTATPATVTVPLANTTSATSELPSTNAQTTPTTTGTTTGKTQQLATSSSNDKASSTIKTNTTTAAASTTATPPISGASRGTGKPKTLLERADDFIGRNLVNFRKFF